MSVVQVIVAPVVVTPEAATLAIAGGGAFDTVTVTPADVPTLPAASDAFALSTWLPFVACVVSQLTWYGALVTGAPRFAPSSRNCTDVTPTLLLALACTLTLADTVAPATGAVTETTGGTVSVCTGLSDTIVAIESPLQMSLFGSHDGQIGL